MLKRSVMTIAAGLPSFFDMAINLAFSFEHWHRGDDVMLYIVTDLDCRVPSRLRQTRTLRVPTGTLPKGFSSKLHLDKFIQSDCCIFLDADCLLMGKLDPIFTAFQHCPVGVFGFVASEGECFGDTAAICQRLNISYLPRFNGGLYFLTRNREATMIFDFARHLEPLYADIGFVPLRGQPNEEMLLAAALAHYGVLPVHNPGNYYADFQWWPQLDRLDAVKGVCRLTNPLPPDPRHQTAYPASTVEPLVLHFLGHHVDSPEYKRAAASLRIQAYELPGSTAIASLISFPHYVARFTRNALRPLYRRMFGVRQVRRSDNRFILD